MNRLHFMLFFSTLIFLSVCFYPISVQGQEGLLDKELKSSSVYDNSAGTSTPWTQQNLYVTDVDQFDLQSDEDEQTVLHAPPGGGGEPPIGGVPIGFGFETLMWLSFIYLFFKIVFKLKKEEK